MTSRPHARSAARRTDERVRVADFVAGLAERQAEADRTPPIGVRQSPPAAVPSPPEPPVGDDAAGDDAIEVDAVVQDLPAARPRIVEDPSILGLSRHSRGRVGSRLFVLFFVLVYAVIVIQLVVALWQEA